jgi:uncharacterized protein YkwD
VRAAAALAVALAWACATRPAATDPLALVRRGPDRARTSYRERAPSAKAALLARLNADRARAGVPAVAYDLVGAKAGDDFCLEAARTGVMGHWDLAGRAPYDRWADAGGVDFHAENFSGSSRRGQPSFRESEIEELLLSAHARMLAEKPPQDGHRKTILDPQWTHVGFGAYVEDGEFRMTEEFSQQVLPWIEIPASPLRGVRSAPFAAQLPKGWSLAAVEIAHERFPRPMTAKDIRRRDAYQFPAGTSTLYPRLFPPHRYADGSQGDVLVSGGTLRADLPLLSGPGSYWVFVYAAPGAVEGRALSPVTAVRITLEGR